MGNNNSKLILPGQPKLQQPVQMSMEEFVQRTVTNIDNMGNELITHKQSLIAQQRILFCLAKLVDDLITSTITSDDQWMLDTSLREEVTQYMSNLEDVYQKKEEGQ